MEIGSTQLEHIALGVAGLIAFAKLIVITTDTPRDDEALSKLGRMWAKAYPVIETIALIVGKTKQQPGDRQKDIATEDATSAQEAISKAKAVLVAVDTILGPTENR